MRPKGRKNTKRYTEWTQEEEHGFRRIYYEVSTTQLAKHFDKSISAVCAKAREFNMMKLPGFPRYKMEDYNKTDKVSGVYCLLNLNNDKVYIGYSDNVGKRVLGHIKSLEIKKHFNSRLQKDWEKFSSKFVFGILQKCDTQEAMIKEQKYLIRLSKKTLYNVNCQHANPPAISAEKFWKRVDIQEDKFVCWNWLGSKDRAGYGGIRKGNKHYVSHRIAYYLHYNKYPNGYIVRHKCHNKSCCNPHHLELGTDKDNARDSVEAGLLGRGNRSRFSEENVKNMIELRKTGWTYKMISKKYSVNGGFICLILTGKVKSLWQFVKDFDHTQYKCQDEYRTKTKPYTYTKKPPSKPRPPQYYLTQSQNIKRWWKIQSVDKHDMDIAYNRFLSDDKNKSTWKQFKKVSESLYWVDYTWDEKDYIVMVDTSRYP